MKSWMTNRCRRPRVGEVQLLTTALKPSLCLFPPALATPLKTFLPKIVFSILLTIVLHHLPLEMQRVRAQQTLTASLSLRLSPLVLLLPIIFSSSTAPSSSGQLGIDSSSCPTGFCHHNWTFRLNDETLQTIHDEMQVLIEHQKPRTRTNVVTTQYMPRGQLFGAYTTRGLASTHATWRFPEVVEAITKLASTRPDGFKI